MKLSGAAILVSRGMKVLQAAPATYPYRSALSEAQLMGAPKIEVLGVYRLDVSDNLFREQFEILYGFPVSPTERDDAEDQCREQLESVVLIEVILSNRDSRFRVADFAQAVAGQTYDNWQVAWAEAYLAANGESLLVERWADMPADDPLRLAFFIHYWDAELPLQSSYGEIPCRTPQPMPERLKCLVPYEPVD